MENLRLGAGNAVITGAATSMHSPTCKKKRGCADYNHLSPGTGLSTALKFAEHGCDQVYLGDNTLETLEDCRNTIQKQYPSVKVHIQEFDRSEEEAVDKFFSKVTATLKRIDFAVNVVSQAQEPELPTEHSIPGFDRNFRVYQRGVCVT